jgi:hypothetical protein
MSLLGLALAGFAAVGCSATTTTDLDASTYVYPDTATGPTLYPLSPGAYCYDITGVIGTVSDGCGIEVATLVGNAYPGIFDSSTGQFTLGKEGSLGTGLISQNVGPLRRDGTTSDGTPCTWHQTDTTTLTMTGQNQFTVSVTETEDTFAAACGATAPTGGTCTSTWTWSMGIDPDPTRLPAGNPLACQ